MYACICRQITEADVRRAGRAGVLTPDRLVADLGLDDATCCGRCAESIEDFVVLAFEGAALGRHLHVNTPMSTQPRVSRELCGVDG